MPLNEIDTKQLEGIVTTPRERDDLLPRAHADASSLGLKVVSRRGASIQALLDGYGAKGVWVVTDGFPIVHTRLGPIEYHEGSAVLRTHRRVEKPDAIIRAMDIRPDDRILDATLGMAVDSLVAATALSDNGAIIGLESNLLLHALVKRGLSEFGFKTQVLRAAASRIRPLHADHREFLSTCGDMEYDVVYFDPMFAVSVAASKMMHRIRELADESLLDKDTVALARIVAKRRVVVKGRRGYDMNIDFDEIIPSGGSVFYGVINA